MTDSTRLPEAWRTLPALALREPRMPLPPTFTLPVTLMAPGRAPARIAMDLAAPLPSPLVSCLMVTRGALWPACHAIECFRRQTWGARELLIVDDSAQSPLAAAVDALADPRIRHVRLPPSTQTLGDLRNLAVALAAGDIVCQWDDDDLYDPLRLELGVRALAASGADAVFLERWLTWWPQQRRLGVSKRYLWEGSMLARRAALPFYASVRKGEDTLLVDALRRAGTVASLDLPWLYCYDITGRNTWDALHFEQMVRESTIRFDGADYAALLDELDRRMPLHAFERDLARADAEAARASAAAAAAATTDGDAGADADPARTARVAAPGMTDDAPALPAAEVAAAAPKVSIVVRSMGRPELVEALSSLARQTYASLEVIVVDATGGRHPPLPALPAALDVRLVGAGRPLKRPAAANCGFAAATGDWLGLLDDDDFLEPTHVARLVARTRDADRPDLVHAAGWLLDRFHRVIDERNDAHNALTAYFVCPFLPMAVLFARSHWERGLRFDESLDVFEDWDFWLQVLVHARVGRVGAHTHFFCQEAGTSGTGIGRNRGSAYLERQKQLHERWHLRRNSQWLEHYKRFGPGLALQAQGRHAEARAHFARLLAASPGEPNALFQLGQSVGQEGTLYAARNLIEDALRLNRNAGEYHMALARIEEALGNDGDAVRQFEAAARLVPAQEAALAKEIARIRARLAAGDGAAPAVVRALAAAGQNAIARNALCPCGSGLRYKACHGRAGAVPLEAPVVAGGGTGAQSPPAESVPARAAAEVDAMLRDAIAAFRRGDPALASALCDSVLAAQPGQREALHARALLAGDRGDVAAAQRALDAMPPALQREPEIARYQARIRRAARRQRETLRATQMIRELPFLRDRGDDGGAESPAASHAHIVLSAHRGIHAATLPTAFRLRDALSDAAPATIWIADTDVSMHALPEGCRALRPEDDAIPRDGAVVFLDVPTLPPTWLAVAGAQRIVVRHRPDRAAETLELLVTCHRHSSLPVRLVHGSEAARARESLPGLVLPVPALAVQRGAQRDRSTPFVVGLAGDNHPRDFDPGIAALMRRLAAAGARVRVRGGTLLLRHFTPSIVDPAIALLPVDGESREEFLGTIDCYLHWPGPRRPSVLPALFDDAMASGLPVVCVRDADQAAAIDDGRSGLLFADADAAVASVARLAADGALASAIGAAAAASAQAWTGAAVRAPIQALLLR